MKSKSPSQPFKPKPGAYEFVSFPEQTLSTHTNSSTTPHSPLLCSTCDAGSDANEQSSKDGSDRVVFRD